MLGCNSDFSRSSRNRNRNRNPIPGFPRATGNRNLPLSRRIASKRRSRGGLFLTELHPQNIGLWPRAHPGRRHSPINLQLFVVESAVHGITIAITITITSSKREHEKSELHPNCWQSGLGTCSLGHYTHCVISILRFVGVLNASVWFGAAIFFTAAVGPAFFSPEMIQLLGKPRAGAAAQLVLSRYFTLHLCCGLVALGHLTVGWLYSGKPAERWLLSTVTGVMILGSVGGGWLLPQMRQLHAAKYDARSTPAVRETSARSFSAWHGVSQGLNLIALVALGGYFWRIMNPPDAPFFVSANKFRS